MGGGSSLTDIMNNHKSVFTRIKEDIDGNLDSSTVATLLKKIKNEKNYERYGILFCYIEFPINKNGDRGVILSNYDYSVSIAGSSTKSPLNNKARVSFCYPLWLQVGEEVNIRFYQDSGETLSYTGRIVQLWFDGNK